MTSLEKTQLVVETARGRQAEDVIALDVRELASFADTFVIATGRSDRQVRAIVDAIEQAVMRAGEKPLGIEGYAEGRWVLVDLADVIVHVLHPDARSYYDLERLWSDAVTLEFASSAQRTAR